MKKTLKKETTICDACGAEAPHGYTCLVCGTDHCYECSKLNGVSYSHGVHFSGSGDGYYCLKCDADLSAKGTDPRHNAYRKIQELRREEKAWYENFRERQGRAEEDVKLLSKAR